MKRIVVVVPILLSAIALGGMATASSASAVVLCYPVDEAKTGNHELANCKDAEAAGGKYILAEIVKHIEGSLWCAEVFTNGTGNYEDNGCTKKKAKGKFILVEIPKHGELVNGSGGNLVNAGFKATSGETKLETVSGLDVICAADTVEGSVLSRTSFTQTVSFSKCKNSIGQKCKGGNAGATGAEEIKIGGLLVDIVYAPKTGSANLLLLTKIPGTFSFMCSTVKEEVKGSFLAPVGTSQEETAKSSFLFTATTSAAGVQTQTKYEVNFEAGEKEAILEAKLAGGSFEQSSEAGTENVMFEEEVKFV